MLAYPSTSTHAPKQHAYAESSCSSSDSVIPPDCAMIPAPVDGVDYFRIGDTVRVRRYLPKKRTHTPYRLARVIRPIVGPINGVGVQRSYVVVITDENLPGKGEEKTYVPALGEIAAMHPVVMDSRTRATYRAHQKLQEYIAREEEIQAAFVAQRLERENINHHHHHRQRTQHGDYEKHRAVQMYQQQPPQPQTMPCQAKSKTPWVYAYLPDMTQGRSTNPRMRWVPSVLMSPRENRPARVYVPTRDHSVYDNVAHILPFTSESAAECKRRGQEIE